MTNECIGQMACLPGRQVIQQTAQYLILSTSGTHILQVRQTIAAGTHMLTHCYFSELPSADSDSTIELVQQNAWGL
jgi:hypothetical protein